MIMINHKFCKNPAFLYEHSPVAGERILNAKARHLDGSHFNVGEPLYRCESCKGMIRGGCDLEPGAPVLRTFDMSSTEDMQELYGTED